jgi:hypothetical protein
VRENIRTYLKIPRGREAGLAGLRSQERCVVVFYLSASDAAERPQSRFPKGDCLAGPVLRALRVAPAIRRGSRLGFGSAVTETLTGNSEMGSRNREIIGAKSAPWIG